MIRKFRSVINEADHMSDDEIKHHMNWLNQWKHRRATDEEIRNKNPLAVKHGTRVRFRHFTGEHVDNRTEHGVRHKQYGSSKLYDVGGKLHVKHHGKMHAVRATHTTLPGGREHVHDIRLDSDHLKGTEDE